MENSYEDNDNDCLFLGNGEISLSDLTAVNIGLNHLKYRIVLGQSPNFHTSADLILPIYTNWSLFSLPHLLSP